METIKIISASDGKYAQHLGVMLTSVLENTSSPRNFEFFVIDGGIAKQDRESLKACVGVYGCNLHFLTPSPALYEKFAASPSDSYATYYRIFIPELVDDSVEKIIYLDCDMVIKGDIVKLWGVDLARYYIAAVEDAGLEGNNHYGIYIKQNLGIPKRFRYFNAGVLVINLRLWRRDQISKAIYDFLIGHPEKTFFADQDGLNVILCDKWLQLPLEWNQQVSHFELLRKKRARQEMMVAIEHPLIIHYTTGSKPWHYLNLHPFKAEYYRYLKLTPWQDFVPKGRTFPNQIVKLFLKTFIGKALQNYFTTINGYFFHDSKNIPPDLANSLIFKILYFTLFPLGFGYMRALTWVIKLSYYLESKKCKKTVFKSYLLATFLYLISFPARFLIPKAVRTFWKNDMAISKHSCPCCGYKEFRKEPAGSNEICEICFWEYDPVQHANPDAPNGANEVSLRQAQANFLEFGASEPRFRFLVRKPCFCDEKEIQKEDSSKITVSMNI